MKLSVKSKKNAPAPAAVFDPTDEDEAFVAAMETVLEVYQRPEDPAFPVVAMDEAVARRYPRPRACEAGTHRTCGLRVSPKQKTGCFPVYRSLSRVSTRLGPRAANRYRLGGGSQAPPR